jgi:hypothetical protein
MQCPQCQQDNSPQAKFCLECGSRLVLTGAQCGTELPPDAKFCLECGQPVDSQSAMLSQFVAPAIYTPKYLAEEIGMRPLKAHCHHGLRTLYSQTDRVEPARAELSAAITLYRAMAMTFWLPEVETALARTSTIS